MRTLTPRRGRARLARGREGVHRCSRGRRAARLAGARSPFGESDQNACPEPQTPKQATPPSQYLRPLARRFG